jgi:hypothetical protein
VTEPKAGFHDDRCTQRANRRAPGSLPGLTLRTAISPRMKTSPARAPTAPPPL